MRFMHCFEASFNVNMSANTEATSVRLQQALLLYQVQLIKLDSGWEKRFSALNKSV